jgi:replicative DNA helicase
VQARITAIAENFARLHAAGRRGSAVVIAGAEEYEQLKKNGRPGMLTTGIPALDKLTGGLPRKLFMILGPPGTFKSGLMASMLRQQLRAGLKVLVVSLEDRDVWVVKRYAAADLGMKVRDVFNAPFPDEERAAEALSGISKELHESFWVTRRHVRTAEDIDRTVRQYRAQHAIDLAYVDNARAVKPPVDPKARFEDRRLAQSRMYEMFAETADTLQIPIGVLAHTSRKYFERTQGKGPPVMSDIGETSDAEKDVRLLLALWKKRGQLRITIGKQNENRVDDDPTVELGMLGESALVDADSGAEVSLTKEEREERDRAEDAKLEFARRKELEQAKWRTTVKEPELAKIKASAAVKFEKQEPSPQAELPMQVQPLRSLRRSRSSKAARARSPSRDASLVRAALVPAVRPRRSPRAAGGSGHPDVLDLQPVRQVRPDR